MPHICQEMLVELKRRNQIFSIIIIVVGATWMICGTFFEEPGRLDRQRRRP